MTPPSTMRPNIPALTSLRFFAALLVVIFHYDISRQVLIPLSAFGYEAVTFFFVLSGFILTYVHVETGNLNLSNAAFLWRRVARIGPAYYAALVVGAPFFLLSAIHEHMPWHMFVIGLVLVSLALQSFLPNAALLYNIPAWSLSVEMFLYACFAPTVRAVRLIGTSRILLLTYVFVIIVSILRFMLASQFDDTAWWYNFFAYFPLWHLPQFLLGIALATTFVAYKRYIRGNMFDTMFLLSVLLLALVICYVKSVTFLSNNIVLAPLFGLMIFGGAGSTFRILDHPLLVLLGEASYALYILHFPLWQWWFFLVTNRLNLPLAVDVTLYVGWVIFLSVLTYKYVENPARRWLISAPTRFLAAPSQKRVG